MKKINKLNENRVLVGVCGASGSIYADSLIQALLKKEVQTYVVFTHTALKVVNAELPGSLLASFSGSRLTAGWNRDHSVLEAAARVGISETQLTYLKKFDIDDFFSPVASGSSGATHMVVIPCSMGTLARISSGQSTCLLERAADVMLKERRALIVVPRESPLHLIHLRNMVQLSEAGAVILPAMPSFYHNPKSISDLIDFFVQRVIDQLSIRPFSDDPRWRWNLPSL